MEKESERSIEIERREEEYRKKDNETGIWEGGIEAERGEKIGRD